MPDLAPSNKTKAIRVLHVDDDPSLLEISKQILMDMGNFEIEHTCCVDEAFKKLSIGNYDVVISDYEMSVKNGLDLLKDLRDEKIEIPFILFTGKGREEVAVKALNLGADAYINKQGNPETVYGELSYSIVKTIEHKNSKKALIESELKYRAYVENSPLAFMVGNSDGKLEEVNDVACKMLGYSRKELLEMTVVELVFKEDLSTALKQLSVLTERGKFQLEFRLKKKDGQPVYVTINAVKLPDGKLMSFCEDITERKKTEESLKQERDMLESVTKASGAGLGIVSKDYHILWANEFIKRYKGDTIGKQCYSTLNSLDAPCQDCGVAKIFAGKTTLDSHENCSTTVDGTPYWIEIVATPLTDENGNITSAVEICVDITERKKTEEARRKSEKEYSALFANMIDGFAYCKMILDENDNPVDFVYLQINDAFERITGLKREMVLGKKVTQAIPNIIEANHEIFEIYGRVALTGQKEKFEVFFKPLSLWLNISVYSPAKGYFATVFEDITEHKKAKRELQESEKRYRSLFEQAPLPVTITTVDGTILDANIAMQTFTGYSLEELKKIPAAYSYENPQDKKTLHKTLKRDNVVSDFSTRLKRIDGNLVDVVLNVSKFKIGKDIVLRTTIQDVTEQKKAEKALQESQQKFKALFSANPDPAAFLDIDFNVIEANSQFSTLFGYTFDEIKSKNVMDLIVPDDSKEEAINIRQTIISDSIEIFTTRRKKDGTQIPLFLSGGPVFVNGKVIGSIMVYKDISDIITVQEELSNALDKAELLNEKLNVVGGLTRHDVRNKLSSVTGYAYLLKKKHNDQADIVDGLSKMEQAVAESMKIFDFAKMYEQLGVEDLAYINVEAKIKEAITLFSGTIPNIIIECKGLVVLADSFLSQLFYNFIDNTRKYGKRATTIRIHYEKAESENLKLFYEDDGVGVPYENKPRIFKEGFSTGGSTGFGLFFTKRMMDVYGWQIQEDGTPGKGAKFTITIPKISQNGKENFQIGP